MGTEVAIAAPSGAIIECKADAVLGPAMKALNERQRNFVTALLQMGTSNHAAAAKLAGYVGNSDTIKVTGYRLAHDSRIQAAIQEEAQRRINGAASMAASVLVDIAENSVDHKTKLKAVEMILNRAGLHAKSEHTVKVEDNRNDQDTIAKLKQLAADLGLDAKKLLGSVGAVDAEFVDVTPKAESDTEGTLEGLEDLL